MGGIAPGGWVGGSPWLVCVGRKGKVVWVGRLSIVPGRCGTTLIPFRVWRWGVLHLATGLVDRRAWEVGGRDGSFVGGVVGWVVGFSGRRCAVVPVGED